MNIFLKLRQKIEETVQEIILLTSTMYFKSILICGLTIILFTHLTIADEIIITSDSPKIHQTKARIEGYGEFNKRKVERIPYNRYRSLPTYTPNSTYSSYTSINLEELKSHIPQEFFQPKIDYQDIPNEAIDNPHFKNDPVYKKMATKKRPISRIRHFTNYYPQSDDDPLPTYSENSSSSKFELSDNYDYPPTKEIILLTSLSNDWEDSYIYTTQLLSQRIVTEGNRSSLAKVNHLR
jgi:hypothetical protein